MKTLFNNIIFKKWGRKALIAYLCWCIVKGIVFIIVGYKIFGN